MIVRTSTLIHLSKTQLLDQIELQLRAKARMGVARRLAPQLITQLFIPPEGVDLICWIADARCRTNQEAIVHWINTQLIELESQDTLLGHPLIEEMISRLVRTLHRLEAANS